MGGDKCQAQPAAGIRLATTHLSSYRGSRARRRPGSLCALEFSILDGGLLLQAREGSFYGFALAKHLAGAPGSSLTAHGTLYKSLARLVELGILDTVWEDATIAEAEGRPRRRLYTVTGEGVQAHARARAATLVSEAQPPGVPALPSRLGHAVGASLRRTPTDS